MGTLCVDQEQVRVDVSQLHVELGLKKGSRSGVLNEQGESEPTTSPYRGQNGVP